MSPHHRNYQVRVNGELQPERMSSEEAVTYATKLRAEGKRAFAEPRISPGWRFRAWLLTPRRMSVVDRAVILTLFIIAIFLIARTQVLATQTKNNGAARACISYGADEQVYSLLLNSPRRPGDQQFRDLLSRSVNAKRDLRARLHCPAYQPPPSGVQTP